nr:hypothetical protein [uncultured Acidovorax sp.]
MNQAKTTTATTAGKFMKFDPTINSGTILQIVVVAASAFGIYSGMRVDQAATKVKVEAIEAAANADRQQTKETLADLRSDLKELQKSTQDIKESLAILRGRAAEPGGRK